MEYTSIPVHFNKVNSISSTDIHYIASDSGGNPPGDNADWKTSVDQAAPQPGQYLWTRFTLNYTNGNSSISYSVSRVGEDGTSASKYRIETNQEEILKFYQSEDFVFSPKKLNISISVENSNEKGSFP